MIRAYLCFKYEILKAMAKLLKIKAGWKLNRHNTNVGEVSSSLTSSPCYSCLLRLMRNRELIHSRNSKQDIVKWGLRFEKSWYAKIQFLLFKIKRFYVVFLSIIVFLFLTNIDRLADKPKHRYSSLFYCQVLWV